MSAAIFGLIGVVIGALVTGGLELLSETRRRKADRRQAIRLVAQDIRVILADFEILVDLGRWPVKQDVFLPSDAWDAHRTTLARELDQESWSALASLMATVPFMRMYANEHLGQPLSPGEIESYREGVEHFATVYEQLTGAPPVSGRT